MVLPWSFSPELRCECSCPACIGLWHASRIGDPYLMFAHIIGRIRGMPVHSGCLYRACTSNFGNVRCLYLQKLVIEFSTCWFVSFWVRLVLRALCKGLITTYSSSCPMPVQAQMWDLMWWIPVCLLEARRESSPSLLLVLKWGGELTPAGRVQAEELGRAFRCMYPGGQGELVQVPLVLPHGCPAQVRLAQASGAIYSLWD